MNRLQRRAEILPEYPLEVPILSVCHKVHEVVTGACDPLPCWVCDQYVRFLEVVLETWEPNPHKKAQRYDAAVRHLVEAALAEADCARRNHAEEFPALPQNHGQPGVSGDRLHGAD